MLLLSTPAMAQLTVFAPDSPALASEVNGNFSYLKGWVEAKVGTFGTGAPPAASSSGIRTSQVGFGNGGNLWFWAVDGVDRATLGYFGSANPRLSVDGNDNTVRAAGSFVGSTTPDLAETIAAAPDVVAADVVCADPSHSERVVRCRLGDRAVLGAISDGTSTFMINSRAGSVDAPLTGSPLVLAGRVPVRVTSENGPIRIGDLLTPSSTPGAAMRATGPGVSVGIALEAFDGRQGQVLTFVKVGDGNVAAELVRLTERNRELTSRLETANRRMDALEARLNALAPVGLRRSSPVKTKASAPTTAGAR